MILEIEQIISQDYCLKCKGCCRFAQVDSVWAPALTKDEAAELLKNHISALLITDNYRVKTASAPGLEVPICSFLNPEDNKCKVYSFRPLECRLYPFLINRSADKVYLAVDLNCPFAQREYKGFRFEEYTGYLASILNAEQVINLLKNNPQLIQTYQDVTNLKKLCI